ncbi:short-chain dehydrogenase [Paenibacillus swuensis]|uniref:Short-chain dehydrogenase n=1 Tax=Paenibacillus swuensis TaxID=1178515 RepID=A0A172TI72_9BACL|nr:SDR family oxidoreductase [Paenibacillus swuensis]ANE46656.1 short-chain dehydrogenase [Paenibacillus swuensis]
MRKTILITGASAGIGKATMDHFVRNNWNVAATMRNPENSGLNESASLKLYTLDVTNEESVKDALAGAIRDFGRIDAVLNNAGYGAVGVFEASTPEQIRRQYETNVFGTMSVIQAILPHFREHRAGTIINVTSVGGKVTFPLYSLYHGSKWALEGFSESLHYELKPLGINVKIIEPGVIKTDFYSRSQDFINNEALAEYQPYVKAVSAVMQQSGANGVRPEVVAEMIFKAATDGSARLRYAVGSPAPWLLPLRKFLPEKWFFAIVRASVEKGLK